MEPLQRVRRPALSHVLERKGPVADEIVVRGAEEHGRHLGELPPKQVTIPVERLPSASASGRARRQAVASDTTLGAQNPHGGTS